MLTGPADWLHACDDLLARGCLSFLAVNKSLSIDLKPNGVESVLLHPGYVATDMVGGNGLIDSKTSVEGMLRVLESGKPLNGRWWAWDGKEVPW